MHPLSMKFLCHFKMDLLVCGSTLNLRSKVSCTVTILFILWYSSAHQPRCCEVSAILHFTALWRRAGKIWKFLELMYLQSHIYKNIPVSFDFITTWNQWIFLCSLCILLCSCINNLGKVNINPLDLFIIRPSLDTASLTYIHCTWYTNVYCT